MKEGINVESFANIAKAFLVKVPDLRERLARFGIEEENIDKIMKELNDVPSDATSGNK